MESRSLDDILADLGLLDQIDFIKLDIQGAERVALQGATEALKRATFVTAELSTVAFNSAGSACYYEVDALVRANGYFMHDIIELHRGLPQNFHGIGQFDVIWIRPTSSRLPAPAQSTKEP